jgi:hypothetical protein
VSNITVRIGLGRTINLGNFESLRVDVAHEVAVEGDRAAAVAEATRLCREDLAAMVAAESAKRVVGREQLDTVLQAQAGVSQLLQQTGVLVALLNDLAQSGALTPEQLERTRATLESVGDDIPF